MGFNLSIKSRLYLQRWTKKTAAFHGTNNFVYFLLSRRAILREQDLARIWHQHEFENQTLLCHAAEDWTHVVTVVSRY